MYNVFLVDDEPLIIDGLKVLIPWKDLDLQVIGTAHNGKEALKKLEESPCDILLTDIKMPEMDGLALINRLKRVHPGTKCVVLSGFQEFEYVKEGLSLGIENYLLKPVNEQELMSTLRNAVEKLEKSSVDEEAYFVLRDNTIWRWLNEDIDSKEWRDRLELYQLQFDECDTTVLVIQLMENDSLGSEELYTLRTHIEKKLENVCIVNPEGEFVVLVTSHNQEECSKKIKTIEVLLEQEGIDYFIFKGSTVAYMNECYQSLSVAKKLTSFRLLLKGSCVISEDDMNPYKEGYIENHESIQQIIKWVVTKESSQAIKEVKRIIKEFGNQVSFISPHGIQSFAIELVTSIQTEVMKHPSEKITEYVREIISVQSLGNLEDLLVSYIESTVRHLQEQSENGSPIIQSVLKFIQEHYHEEQSLKTLSQKFHVNSIYLGQLFHKETGYIFSDYLNQLRIHHAKELLKDTYNKVGDIGKQVGYSDSTYFYKQFKKIIGVTPKEYRLLALQKTAK
ncbi:response regulator transcription factor [Heyndrickxia camelliae]|uniref:DNA-binding response regulator n=1 Tax=Heyndrickxia camelliae TaxID=1707093 RepID=A0A2N3LP02_9BACI|nr:response regulator transcription factor [Heyndrickxia camelliae]PKR86348.1 hypothetical protein CWO92_04410 [Heyndrickxia camelliae]